MSHHNQIQQRKDTSRTSSTSIRSLSCELETLHNCDGSALYHNGSTIILASVHGPIATKHYTSENQSNLIVSVVIKSSTNSNYREWEQFISKQLSSCIILSQYPKCVISINIQILNDDGSILSSILMSSILALLNASIEMNYIPIPVTCCYYNNDTTATTNDNNNIQILLDPTKEEEELSYGVVTFVFSNRPRTIYNNKDDDNDDITDTMIMTGCYTSMLTSLTQVLLWKSWTISSNAISSLDAFIRLVIEQKVKREAQTFLST